ncbi:hypothetical protein FLA_1932 [Filimonas lacunae]|nr:hypothetical protein FLA_1932 [Filimonas lacunae]
MLTRLRTFLLLFFTTVCISVKSQTSPNNQKQASLTDVFRAQCKACIAKAANKTACYKQWYQQTDSLLETYYKSLLTTSDSTQKVNLEDERQDWLVQRNSFFKKSYSSYNKNRPDEAARIFADNIDFVNQRIRKLATAQSTDYSPERYQVSFNGAYSFDDQVTDDDQVYLLKADMKVKMADAEKGWFRLFARMNVSEEYDGMLIDTLTIRNNKATYQYYVNGGVCKIGFSFSRQGVYVKEETENKNLDCAFGQALPLFGFYRKTSSRTPTNREMLKDRL